MSDLTNSSNWTLSPIPFPPRSFGIPITTSLPTGPVTAESGRLSSSSITSIVKKSRPTLLLTCLLLMQLFQEARETLINWSQFSMINICSFMNKTPEETIRYGCGMETLVSIGIPRAMKSQVGAG